MASIIYDKNFDYFYIYRGEIDNDGNPIGEYYRDYMKKYPVIIFMGSEKIDKKLKIIRDTRIDLLRVFGKDINGDIPNGLILSKDFDCWVCFDSECRTVLYFGEDIPTRKERFYKTMAPTVQKWMLYKKRYENGNLVRFWEVKEPNKMIIVSLDYEKLFPELFDRNYVKYINRCDYLWNIEPFRIKRNWDIPEDIKAEIKAKEEQKRQKEEMERQRIENLKHTEGFCDICGRKAEYKVITPYETKEFCEYCYYNYR